ncbi:unnamed protein product [Rangifer tarandus platyrhynchus]|uniref:Uncharacterized protein n=1 Tax=Rangifer tarandus platyrhynchus TaxID=3082113 RepID=A0AC60A6E6_RANTA
MVGRGQTETVCSIGTWPALREDPLSQGHHSSGPHEGQKAGALPPEWGTSPLSQRHILGRGPAVCPRRAWGAQPTLPTAGPERDHRWTRGRTVESAVPP